MIFSKRLLIAGLMVIFISLLFCNPSDNNRNPNDLAATNIVGPRFVVAGEHFTYQITITNSGTETQDTYTVRLTNQHNQVLAQINIIENIAPEQSIQFNLHWSPERFHTNFMVLFGEVLLQGDNAPDNNKTAPFRVLTYTEPSPIKAWGNLSYGLEELPDYGDFISITTGDYHAVGLRANGTLVCWGAGTTNTGTFPNYGQSITPEGNDFIAIASGDMHNIALKEDGSLIAWGRNNYGQLYVPEEDDFVAIACGAYNGLAIRADGTLAGWGAGITNLGTFPHFGQSIVPEGNDFIAIDSGAAHTTALKMNGSLIAWGRNNFGQANAPFGNMFSSISVSNYHNLALKIDGTIVAWGRNTDGQCDVPYFNDFVEVSAGREHSLAIRNNDSLVSWGMNTWGQSDAPEGFHFKAISAGYQHNFALIGMEYALTSPIGTEVWQAGTNRLITWYYRGENLPLLLQLSIDNGLNWLDIATVNTSDCIYNWSLPLLESDNCRVRGVFYYNEEELLMQGSDTFTIRNEAVPYLTLISPSAENTRIQMEKPYLIEWESDGVEFIDILFSPDNGLSWTTLVTEYIAENGSFEWLTPDINTQFGRIKIKDRYNYHVNHCSLHPFTTVKLNLLSNMNGLELQGGNFYNIQYSAVNVERFRVSYSPDAGETWTAISNDWGQNSFNWLIPNVEANEAMIKISDYFNDNIFATTATFSLHKPITLISPAPGENLRVGFVYNIQWTAIDDVDNVLIEYSFNNGTDWLPVRVTPYPAGEGNYNWIVPNTQSQFCLVRVKNAGNHYAYGINSAPFTISDKSLVLTAPMGGETFYPETEIPISWTAINTANIDIDFSYDEGENWMNLAGNIPAVNSPFFWTIPVLNTSMGIIRIKDSSNWMINNSNEEYFSIIYFSPPLNLTGVFEEGIVQLNWEAPEGIEISQRRANRNRENNFLGYNLFRNEELVNNELLSNNQYSDINYAMSNIYFVTAVYEQGESEPSNFVEIIITNLDDKTQTAYTDKLTGNYPNPFNPETTISFTLSKPSNIKLQIFNLKGQLLRTLADNTLPAGNHKIVWDGKNDQKINVGSGIYFYRIITDNFNATQKMLLLQ